MQLLELALQRPAPLPLPARLHPLGLHLLPRPLDLVAEMAELDLGALAHLHHVGEPHLQCFGLSLSLVMGCAALPQLGLDGLPGLLLVVSLVLRVLELGLRCLQPVPQLLCVVPPIGHRRLAPGPGGGSALAIHILQPRAEVVDLDGSTPQPQVLELQVTKPLVQGLVLLHQLVVDLGAVCVGRGPRLQALVAARAHRLRHHLAQAKGREGTIELRPGILDDRLEVRGRRGAAPSACIGRRGRHTPFAGAEGHALN
mmetsp:Transcript_57678/g.163802  ORF Transcript_57678/g.163802 Transcript_57678/m.163802 type:complete len:256 (+) Transcript_57678:561-1328(+)